MDDKPTSTKRPWTLRRKLLIAIPLIIIILGLALGLGLGLTIGRNGDDDDDGGDESAPSVTASPLPTPTGTLPWAPKVSDTWQIVLQNNIVLSSDQTSVTPNVSIFDIDLFDSPKETIDALHRLGKKVICYFSAGSYEPGRPDSAQFKEADMGKGLEGWPGERWLRLDSENVRKIMKARVELAGQKGCDGVDPDNVDGYQNKNGLSLTAQASIDYMAYLSSLTQPLNLTLGLKNAGDIIPAVRSIVHFSVNEQCVAESECSTFHQFIDDGKPVFHIEYPSGAGQKLKADLVGKFCGTGGDAKGREGFSTVLKKMELDGWVEYCDGKIEVTAMNQTDKGN